MVLILSLVMGACGSSEDTNDTKPTKSDNTTTPNKDKEETVKVTFDLNYEKATGTPSAQTIKKGDKAKVPTPQPTRAKYKLTNWYTDQATTKKFAFTTPINKNITLYAKWQKTVYTVTFDVNGGTGTVAEQPIPENGKATAPTDNPTKDGYTFDGWYEKQDGSGTVFAFTTTLILADITLYAKWTAIITYTVTFDGNYTGAAAPTTVTVAKDDKATKPADPTRDGYTFDNWYTDAATKNVFAFGTTPITADTTLYAKWICPAREERKALAHTVPLYNQGEADAPYLPKALRRTDFKDESGKSLVTLFWNKPTIPKGKEDELPYIYPTNNTNYELKTGGFDITPDYIDASLFVSGFQTIRISCYSVKQVNDSLYFYYGKVRFLFGGQETEENNKVMYGWTGIDQRGGSNKDALYGYMVSIQGDYLRPLNIYPFVGGKYTRASDGTTVTFPKTEAEYAALTQDQLKIIATAPLTSDNLFEVLPGDRRPGIYGLPLYNN